MKELHKAGEVADQTALHHTAQNNKLDVVKYLLGMGVKDTCMKCDGSFYCLKSEMHRLQSKVRKTTIFSDVFNDIQEHSVVLTYILTILEIILQNFTLMTRTTLGTQTISSGWMYL